MAKFCRYCGTPLSETGVCDCAQTKAEMEQNAAATMVAQPIPQPISQPISQPTPPPAPQATPANSAGMSNLTEMKDIFLQFWKSPISLFRSAVQKENKVPQLLMTAAFALLTIILVLFMGNGNMVFEDIALKIGFTTALTFVAIRLAYSSGVYFLAKRQNPTLDFMTVVGVFSITFAFDIVMLVLLILFSMISLFELAIAFSLFWLVATAIISYIATWTVMREDIEASYKATLIIQVVLMVVLVFVIRGFAANTLSGAMGSMMGYPW